MICAQNLEESLICVRGHYYIITKEVNVMKQNKNEIQWKQLLKKAVEDGLMKAVELAVLAIIFGLTMKLMVVALSAVTVSSMVTTATKLKFLE